MTADLAPRPVPEVAADILRLAGGRANLTDVTQCFVRLRLTLVQADLADRGALRELPEVVVLVEQHGQLQIALRNRLTEVHDALRGLWGGAGAG